MSKFGDLNPAFSGTGRSSSNNPDASFNSRPSSGGLSKPRFSKVRRQVKSQNLKPSATSDSLPSGQGFNPFHFHGSFGRTSNEGFVFGSTDAEDIGKRVLEEMGMLRIEGEGTDYLNKNEHLPSRLPQDLKDSHSSFSFGVQKGTSNVEDELPTLLSNKLTIDSSSSSRSTGHVMQESMEKLNISEQSNNIKSKESMDYVGEKILSDELSRKLSVGSMSTDGNLSADSVQGSVNEKKVDDFSSSCPMNYSFVVGTEPSEHLNSRNVHHVTSTVNTSEFNFVSYHQDSGVTGFMEFKTPNSKVNPFSSLDQKLGFNAKKDNVGAMRARRKGGKQPVKVQLNIGQEFAFAEGAFTNGSSEAPESYSPMDVSPYEVTADCRDFSAVSDQFPNPDKSHLSSDIPPAVPNDVFDSELVAATVTGGN